ncbi:hypothetical protein G6F22_015579 [Rhizopus arrhizus]|nr:hypothetical protein G6F22_015579 [Rhizopus arrhizus]
MNDTPPVSLPRRSARWLLPLAGVAVLGAGGYAGWYFWQQQQREQAAQAQTTAVQLQGLEATLDALRRDQRATSQRLQDAAPTNRVLRDEMLGLSQRSGAARRGRVAADPGRATPELRRRCGWRTPPVCPGRHCAGRSARQRWPQPAPGAGAGT